MKAIVLTCDAYHPLANLCLASYEKHWPAHPFEFRVAYQDTRRGFDGRSSPLCFVRTPRPIIDTMAGLLGDLDDREWVFWCMDDRYVIRADASVAVKVYEQVLGTEDPGIIAVRLISSTPSSCGGNEVALRPELVEDPRSAGTQFRLLWQHQFVRAGALRRVFQSFPSEPSIPKEMDSFLHLKRAGERILEVRRSVLTLGESTSRGRITANCAVAFRQYGMAIPEGFELDLTKAPIKGEVPVRFLGVSFRPSLEWRLRWLGLLLRYYGFRPWIS